MGKDLNVVDVNNEVVENAVEQPLIELNELSLTIISGGSGCVAF